MKFLDKYLNILNKKSKVDQEKKAEKILKVPSTPPPTPPIHKDTTPTHTLIADDDTRSTSLVSSIKVATDLPQVEFEESRNLLQLDFFSNKSEFADASFSKFDYLLEDDKKAKLKEDLEKKKKSSPPRKLTTTLRHRISLYKSTNGQNPVKRALSSPDMFQQ